MCDAGGPYSWDCYLSNYAGLQRAFGDNLERARNHYLKHGYYEGRSCACVSTGFSSGISTGNPTSSSQESEGGSYTGMAIGAGVATTLLVLFAVVRHYCKHGKLPAPMLPYKARNQAKQQIDRIKGKSTKEARKRSSIALVRMDSAHEVRQDSPEFLRAGSPPAAACRPPAPLAPPTKAQPLQLPTRAALSNFFEVAMNSHSLA